MATTGDVWIIPSLRSWGCVLHVDHISCAIMHYDQHQYATPSLFSILLAGERHYQEITIPIFRLVLQNFAILGYSSCIPSYHYLFSLPFYRLIFMPPPLGAGGIMFSGCPSVRPSVRSLKYPLLTCTWVRWSTRPTVTVLRHVRPSVYRSVRLSVCPSGEVSGHLPENAWRDWPEILYADVSWPSSELISLWLWSVDFSNFCTILT